MRLRWIDLASMPWVKTFLSPLRADSISSTRTTAYAVGCNLSPLRGCTTSGLSKHVFHFAEERPQQWLVVDLRECVQLLQQFFLAFIQLARDLHAYFDVEIALAVSVQNGNAFVADAERGARLRAFGNFQGVLAVQARHATFCAHGRLRHRQRHHAVQIITFAGEEFVFFHVQYNI